MMHPLKALAVTVALLLASGCTTEQQVAPPLPVALNEAAMGRYCGMNLLEHPGPKGQVILSHLPDEPLWFSSVRDAVAFTLLPEEPKNILAIYVSDMAAAPSWEEPGAENWIDARTAFYVVGSSVFGGMGAPEAVPFSTEEAAAGFAAANGGQVVGFAGIPADYVLETAATVPEAPAGRVSEVVGGSDTSD
jgi:copper chaperone NosL